MTVNDGRLAQQIRALGVRWTGREQPSLHKPLLVALLLARYGATGAETATYADISDELTELLVQFEPSGAAPRPYYAFWRLRNDGFWEIAAADDLVVNGAGDVRPGDLTEKYRGRWSDASLAEIREHGSRVFLDLVLERFFQPSVRAAVLAALLKLTGAVPERSAGHAQSLMIWIGGVARSNFEVAQETGTWGMREPVDLQGQSCRYVVFGTYFDFEGNGNVRVASEKWLRGSADLILCEINGPQYRASAVHWPDEVEANRVIYPHRFGFTQRYAIRRAVLKDVLTADAIEALRLAAGNGKPRFVDLAGSGLLSTVDTGATVHDVKPDYMYPESVHLTPEGDIHASRSADPLLRKAVEDRSVLMAVAHMRRRGWTVEPLGKPYDLICTRAGGEEKHVEVKGSTGAAATVNYTPNEVHHFRTCPHGADLIVVRDIRVDPETYETSGGELLHVENYTAPPEDLQPAAWVGRVPDISAGEAGR